MTRSAVAIGLGLLAALAVVAVVLFGNEPSPTPVSQSPNSAIYFDQSAAEERIRALEAAVAEERNARLLLEEELQALYAEIEALGGGATNMTDQERAAQAEEAARRDRERAEERRLRQELTDDERLIEQLTENGFAPERAEWIVKRQSELNMESLRARFEARSSGQPFDPTNPMLSPQAMLRAEIGDDEYEQYLSSTGRPTRVQVTDIFESSPAQRAGLREGDQIVSYNGTRVFDSGELYRHTMGGEPGGTVVVDIVRDGVPMQIVLPSGPIGVSINNRRGR